MGIQNKINFPLIEVYPKIWDTLIMKNQVFAINNRHSTIAWSVIGYVVYKTLLHLAYVTLLTAKKIAVNLLPSVL